MASRSDGGSGCWNGRKLDIIQLWQEASIFCRHLDLVHREKLCLYFQDSDERYSPQIRPFHRIRVTLRDRKYLVQIGR
jgi:hypothetical protein